MSTVKAILKTSKVELSRGCAQGISRRATDQKTRQILLFPRTAQNAPYNSERLCEFCGQPRENVSYGSFAFFKMCGCAGAVAARIAKEADIATREGEQREQRVALLLDRSGLNSGRAARQCFATFTADTAKRRNALSWANSYVASLALAAPAPKWPVIYGSFGVGKTHIARAIAREAIMQYSMSALFVNWLRWYQGLKADFSREKAHVGAVCAAGLLVIDDLDKQPLTEYARTKLYEVVDNRYERAAPTLITTNTSNLDAFLGDDGRAIYSRVEEFAEWVPFACENYRRG